MDRVSVNSFLLLSRRAYTVAAENVRVQSAASVMRNATETSSMGKEVPTGQKEIFWMKDPKSGNYMPESHFNEIDVAELREKALYKKARF
ncbi:hypothetical protein F0562_024234 [Nyssa sinensis]|uniref:Uncharacterized protein n=1 Tax=Nyssa sinensis TaxID=561372 RepID=A0A5J5BAL6_9ASTE|nr:hypothetical protein F0562_024234 [Nyssa sinensis]